jgi:hypothetical protein
MLQMAKDGIKPWFAPAITTSKLGVSSGVGMLWGPGTSLLGSPADLIPGRACAGLFRVPGLDVVYTVSLYGDSCSIDNTITWLDQVIAHCYLAGDPFLIGGDFNVDPRAMQDKLGASPRIKHEIQILAPTTPTCVMHNSRVSLTIG